MTRRTLLVCAVALGCGVALFFLLRAFPWSPGERPPAENTDPAGLKARFTDVTAAAGIRFRHRNGATGRKLLPETMGSGVAVLDYDGDGRQDLLFVSGCPWPGDPDPDQPPGLTLYRNRGDGTFENVTEAAGLNVNFYGMGVCVGDYDNDGFPDVFVTGVGGNRLFHNEEGPDGRRRFVDVTAAAGPVAGPGGWPTGVSQDEFLAWKEPVAFGSSATFVDYDGDGLLDLFVCYYVTWSPAADLAVDATLPAVGRAYVPPTQFDGAHCALYRNLGGGRFRDVSEEAGVRVAGGDGKPVGKALGVVACDADGDGWPDLFVANDTVRNFFFHNVPDGKGGRRFEEKGLTANAAYAAGRPRGAMGVDWGEYRPGGDALLIANFADEPDTFLTLRNRDKLHFADLAGEVGLAGPSRHPLKFGAFFFDCDLDGRLDLLTCNGHLEPDIGRTGRGERYEQAAQLFRNTGDERTYFEPVSEADAGPDLFRPLVGRGCAYLDYDGNGTLDVVLTANNGPARLLRNDNVLGHHWLRLTLEGDGGHSNRSAIGAEVTVEAGGRTLRRRVSGARGYLSQSELLVTVGLGEGTAVDRVTVRWPGRDAGPPQVWTGLKADRSYVLRQGATQARPLR